MDIHPMLKDWLEDLIMFKSIYRLNAISINIPSLLFFWKWKKNPLQNIWNLFKSIYRLNTISINIP